jgi:hypothetical protein
VPETDTTDRVRLLLGLERGTKRRKLAWTKLSNGADHEHDELLVPFAIRGLRSPRRRKFAARGLLGVEGVLGPKLLNDAREVGGGDHGSGKAPVRRASEARASIKAQGCWQASGAAPVSESTISTARDFRCQRVPVSRCGSCLA